MLTDPCTRQPESSFFSIACRHYILKRFTFILIYCIIQHCYYYMMVTAMRESTATVRTLTPDVYIVSIIADIFVTFLLIMLHFVTL